VVKHALDRHAEPRHVGSPYLRVGNLIYRLAAVPREIDYQKTYYHGTPKEEAAQGILSDGGITPPDIGRKRNMLTPVKGKAYLTTSLVYAVIYGFGGVWHSFNVVPDHMMKSGDYGYVFVIPGTELKDIQPDEDNVGEMVADNKVDWLSRMAKQHLTDRQYTKVMEGEYNYWAQAGKKLLKKMTDGQKLELLDYGVHVAHEGMVEFSECWRFLKEGALRIEEDASNFFDVAERCR
jgi:hypothetical protein